MFYAALRRFVHYSVISVDSVTFRLVCFPLQKVDVTSRAVLDIMTKTTEYLQPNPGIKHILKHRSATTCS